MFVYLARTPPLFSSKHQGRWLRCQCVDSNTRLIKCFRPVTILQLTCLELLHSLLYKLDLYICIIKVLILLRVLWTAGAQRIAVNEYRHLEKLGYDPKLVFLRAHTAKGYEDLLKGVSYEVVRESGEGLLMWTPVFRHIFGLFREMFSGLFIIF